MTVVNEYHDGLAEPGDHVEKNNGAVGEVIVRAASKCSCSYFNRADEAKAKYYKGWLYIDDLAKWNDEEYVTIVGRKDDMFISGAEKMKE